MDEDALAQQGPGAQPEPEAVPAEESVARFLERAAPMRQKHADFDATVNAPVFTPEMAAAIYESNVGPELAFYLGKNRAAADRLAALPAAQLLREIGRLEAKFAPTPRAVSGAPSPISPVMGTAGPDKDPEKMSTAEWMAWEKNRQIMRLRQR